MLARLDAVLESHGILSYGIGATTMEEVFLKVADQGAVEGALASHLRNIRFR